MMNLKKNQVSKMWIIIKFKPNQFNTLKQEFKKRLKIEPNFFSPQLKIGKIIHLIIITN